MSTTSQSSSSGIGVLSLLGVVFVTLKLLGKIDWSWWYVTMPFWGVLAIVGLILAALGAFVAAVAIWEAWTR